MVSSTVLPSTAIRITYCKKTINRLPSIRNSTASKNYRLAHKGTNIKALQVKLKNFGYNISVDGYFGPQTERAVKSFQRARGLAPIGIAGVQTLSELDRLNAFKQTMTDVEKVQRAVVAPAQKVSINENLVRGRTKQPRPSYFTSAACQDQKADALIEVITVKGGKRYKMMMTPGEYASYKTYKNEGPIAAIETVVIGGVMIYVAQGLLLTAAESLVVSIGSSSSNMTISGGAVALSGADTLTVEAGVVIDSSQVVTDSLVILFDASTNFGNGSGTEGTGETVDALGGAYKKVPANGGQVHHMPADSVSPLSKRNGPGIRMETADHMDTASWGSSKKAKQYRAKQKELIEQGKFLEAQQMDINDVRSKFGDKYDSGIQQMLEYTDELLK